MKSSWVKLLFVAALALAGPAHAQDAPAASQTEAAVPAPASPPAAPVVTAAEALGNPEYQLALDLSTGGRVIVQLFPEVAPAHVERVKTLARRGFYDGVVFHRVIEGFMAQTGDPTATGEGGSDLPDLKAEFNATPHLRGTVSMARAAADDSANSQFFIMFLPRFSLDKKYTAFGRVVEGMQWVDRITRGEPAANPSRILQASVLADRKPPPAPGALPPSPAATPKEAPITLDQLNAPRR